jgi:hypothetical protein
MNNRKRGKRTEARIAKEMNGKRVGILQSEDIEHPLYSIEVKNREKAACVKWVEQALRNCPDNKIPLVRLHLHNTRYNTDIIMIPVIYFEDYFGHLTRELP